MLVGHEMTIANAVLHALLTFCHLISNVCFPGLIVNYTQVHSHSKVYKSRSSYNGKSRGRPSVINRVSDRAK